MSLQSSVIHNPSTSSQEVNVTDEIISEDEARRRREQLNRRPSYRMILKDLETVDRQLKKDPDDPNAAPIIVQISAQQALNNSTPLDFARNSGSPSDFSEERGRCRDPRIEIVCPTTFFLPRNTQESALTKTTVPSNQMTEQHSLQSRLEQPSYMSPSGVQSLNVQSNGGEVTLNPLTGMPNVGQGTMLGQYSPASSAPRGTGTPKQFQELGPGTGPSSSSVGGMLPMNTDVLGIKTMGNEAPSFVSGNRGLSPEWQTGMMSGYNSSPSPLGMAGVGRADNDDSTRKRQVRLLKNREAAKECRRKKKEYVKCLENRVAVLENQNKALIEELKTLKDLYCRKEKSEL